MMPKQTYYFVQRGHLLYKDFERRLFDLTLSHLARTVSTVNLTKPSDVVYKHKVYNEQFPKRVQIQPILSTEIIIPY